MVVSRVPRLEILPKGGSALFAQKMWVPGQVARYFQGGKKGAQTI
jgi:hypothetical protein